MKIVLYLLFIVFVINTNAFSQSNGLDLSFGNNGIIENYPQITETGFFNTVLQHNGKIIADNRRFNADGSLDEDYRKNADVHLPMVVQYDDKLLCFVYNAGLRQTVLTRLSENGETDISFGNHGIVKQYDSGGIFPFYAAKMLVQEDNKILLIGSYEEGVIPSDDEMPHVVIPPPNITMRRYLPTGIIDSTFGVNGEVFDTVLAMYVNSAPVISSDVWDAVLTNDNSILICSDMSILSSYNYSVFKYTTEGRRDTIFGINGIVSIVPFNLNVSAMTLQNDGKILLAGNSYFASGFALLRLNTDGSPDTSRAYRFENCHTYGCSDIVVLSDDKILLAGTVIEDGEGIKKYGITRLLPDGTTDSSFGKDGTVKAISASCPVSGGGCQLYVALPQPDGKIIGSGGNKMIVRFMANGEEPPEPEKPLILYPNPAKDMIYIEGPMKIKSVTFYDVAGRIVYRDVSGNKEINIQQLSSGIYVFSLTDTTNHTDRFKIVKQ